MAAADKLQEDTNEAHIVLYLKMYRTHICCLFPVSVQQIQKAAAGSKVAYAWGNKLLKHPAAVLGAD